MTASSLRAHEPDSIDADEVARFSGFAKTWWDPKGPVAPLHWMTPFRTDYLRRHIAAHFGRDPDQPEPLAGLRILDVGCGGGIATEPLARLGADMTGIDPTEAAIRAAQYHAGESGLAVEYRAATAEELAAEGRRFDVVLALEVLDHLPAIRPFVTACSEMVKSGGMTVMSTINRTPLAYFIMIVLAENIVRWVPRGTHRYGKFVTPTELRAALAEAGMRVKTALGTKYVPFGGGFSFTRHKSIAYVMFAEKAASTDPAPAAPTGMT